MGFDGEGIIGKTISEVSTENTVDLVDIIDICAKAVSSRKAVAFEKHFHNLHKYFKITVFSESPNKFCMLCVELTELKHKINTFNRYRLLFENSRNLILFLNENGDILEANQAALDAYGYVISEIIGLNIRDLREKGSLGSFEAQFKQAINIGIFFETLHRRRDGSVFPVEVSSIASDLDENKIIMSIIRDISDRKRLESELLYLANHDFLTNIPNRTYVMNKIRPMCEEALTKQERLAVLFFDINKFKRINDNYGHETGDAVLKEISKRIMSVTPGLFGRIGGDEFVILQPFSTSQQEITALVGRIFRNFELPIEHNGISVYVTTSIGISLFPKDSQDIDSLLSYADDAMYYAKKLAGNSCRYYSDIAKQR
jgi:diguanylate cyclase (GGDEF)-like protein/PAS domain S-box-containing protein